MKRNETNKTRFLLNRHFHLFLFQTANDVYGSVLCSPGCFSVYRARAIRDVLPLYASGVDCAMDFLMKDMGKETVAHSEKKLSLVNVYYLFCKDIACTINCLKLFKYHKMCLRAKVESNVK